MVPSTSFKPMNTNKTTHIVNLAGNTYKTLGNNKPLAISISQVFACAQPLPLQEDAKHQSKGKMTTIAGKIIPVYLSVSFTPNAFNSATL